nr:MAG TPA: hypothetical protein [Caudoviricetes sp.]
MKAKKLYQHRLEIAGAIFMPFWRWCPCGS